LAADLGWRAEALFGLHPYRALSPLRRDGPRLPAPARRLHRVSHEH
jgi:hypothetical protein